MSVVQDGHKSDFWAEGNNLPRLKGKPNATCWSIPVAAASPWPRRCTTFYVVFCISVVPQKDAVYDER